MTEAEWIATNDPFELIDHRFGMRSPDSVTSDVRQLQLYFLACAQRTADRLPWIGRELLAAAEQQAAGNALDPLGKSAVRAAAEELVHNTDFADAIQQAEHYYALSGRIRPIDVPAATAEFLPKLWSGTAHLLYYALDAKAPIFAHIPAELYCADLIREVFGNPFLEVWFDPCWRTSAVRDLALSIERSGDYSRMPMLADALEEAGCTDSNVVGHLRTGRGHVRGCWVLDGLLTSADRR